MKSRILAVIFVAIISIISGCANTSKTLGDGKIDAVESASINVAVGVAFSAKPETIVPAYAVTTALLQIMSMGLN